MLDINGWEFLVLILIGLFIFGPERLPKLVGDAARTIRQLRAMARNATNELSESLGTEVALEDLNPKTFVRKHLLSEEDERVLRKPFEDAFAQIREVTDAVNESGAERPEGPGGTVGGLVAAADDRTSAMADDRVSSEDRAPAQTGDRPVARYDEDAT